MFIEMHTVSSIWVLLPTAGAERAGNWNEWSGHQKPPMWRKKCFVHLISCAGVSSENHKWRVSLLLSHQGERTGHGPVWVWRRVYHPSIPAEAEGERGEWGPGSWAPQHSPCSPFSIRATEQCLTDINSKHSSGIFSSPVLMDPPGSWLSFWPPPVSSIVASPGSSLQLKSNDIPVKIPYL